MVNKVKLVWWIGQKLGGMNQIKRVNFDYNNGNILIVTKKGIRYSIILK